MSTELSRLSGIDTPWSAVRRAHAGSQASVDTARQLLLDRYSGAVRRYLHISLRDPDAAEEVFQEFALRLVRGDFRRADPELGHFRNFVKSSLYHLIVDYRRRVARREMRSIESSPGETPAAPEQADLEFIHSWRTELFNRTWTWLQDVQDRTGTPYYSALRHVVDSPDRSSEDVARLLESQLGRSFTAGNARVVVHRARQMFADQLIRDVAESLEVPTRDSVAQELVELQLLEYCRAALARWSGRSPTIE